ncbi:capsule biosynthesis GfcC family protein [Shewanella sp. A3A]|nr:capsule biosynthesis GfcC family protein [Shewanella ferrihydritica]
MKPLRYFLLIAVSFLCADHVYAAQPVNVTAMGQVQLPSSATFSTDDRIGKVVAAAIYQQHAYLTGAAWIRQSFVLHQSARRLLLLNELPNLQLDPALTSSLMQQIKQLRATGRVDVKFDWDLLELTSSQNRYLQQEDQFYVPTRPDTVRVVGAVAPYTVAFVANKTVADYAAELQRLPGADPSYVWVIEPDTSIRKVGIAYWNTEQAYLAPGSYIYVPIADDDQRLEQFQQSLLQLFSAQLLP